MSSHFTILPTCQHGALEIFLNAPNEVLSKILYHTLHTDHEFNTAIEVAEDDGQFEESAVLHGAFAHGILVSSKRFYSLGIEVFWRNICLQSIPCLTEVARLCENGGGFSAPRILGTYTRRLELRLPAGYAPHLVAKVISHMPHLTVFVLRTQEAPFEPTNPRTPSLIVDTLNRSCRNLRRIQLESPVDVPYPADVIHLLNHLPELETLSVFSFSPDIASSPPRSFIAPLLKTRRPLRLLSVGFAIWDPIRYVPDRERLDRFVAALAVTQSLPELRKLELFDFTPSMRQLLHCIGPQLAGLLIVVPPHHDTTANSRNFLENCPNLLHLAWIITDWSFLSQNQKMPSSHVNLENLVLGLCQSPGEDPDAYMPHLLELLQPVVAGNYPGLKSVLVRPRGPYLPQIEGASWFEDVRKNFRRNGVQLNVVA